MYRKYFLIDDIFVLIILAKLYLSLVIFFSWKECCVDKLANLIFIYIESFHLYNRFFSNLFLKFFINIHSLLIYCLKITIDNMI